jgi:lipopolysaccharide transport system ATP-binding protein
VLAVGDIEFQNKCLGKMRDIGQAGRTVLFVSHNLGAIRNLCTRALLLSNGNLIANDNCNLVIDNYLKNCRNLAATPLHHRTDRSGTGDIRITAITASNGQNTSYIQPGKPLILSCSIEFNSPPPANGLNLAIGIDDSAGNRIALLNSEITGPTSLPVTATTHSIDVVIDKLPLTPGNYRLTIFCSANGKILDWIQDAAIILIENNDYYGTGKLPASGQGQLLLVYHFVCRDLSNHNP